MSDNPTLPASASRKHRSYAAKANATGFDKSHDPLKCSLSVSQPLQVDTFSRELPWDELWRHSLG